jgi:hypothetical protein
MPNILTYSKTISTISKIVEIIKKDVIPRRPIAKQKYKQWIARGILILLYFSSDQIINSNNWP